MPKEKPIAVFPGQWQWQSHGRFLHDGHGDALAVDQGAVAVEQQMGDSAHALQLIRTKQGLAMARKSWESSKIEASSRPALKAMVS